MSRAFCPAGCGKKFLTTAHAASHADVAHPDWLIERAKRKGWMTPYGFVDFTHPVTFEHACEVMRSFARKLEPRP